MDDCRNCKKLHAALVDIRDEALEHVDADCVGDPPRYVGNAWASIVNRINEAIGEN